MDSNLFKEYISKLVEIEEKEDKYKNILLEIKKDKEKMNDKIINFMEKNNITDKEIIFGERKIKYMKNKITETITKKLIETRLKQFFKDDNQASSAVNFIYNDRNKNEKVSLKISLLNNKDEKELKK
jgi:hypothetical protein